jgi:predicted enzyme related to lactoylglutathione lyase
MAYKTGQFVWHDLTVPNANAVKDFYNKVIGWQSGEHNMGDYNDYTVALPEDKNAVVGGICHNKGINANIPPVWLLYVVVENVAESAQTCLDNGGKVLDGPRLTGKNNFCIIQDPAGAVLGLIENE